MFELWKLPPKDFWESISFFRVFVSWTVNNFISFGLERVGFHFRKYEISFNRRVRKVHPEIKGIYFKVNVFKHFLSLGLESGPGSR